LIFQFAGYNSEMADTIDKKPKESWTCNELRSELEKLSLVKSGVKDKIFDRLLNVSMSVRGQGPK
jgi:hypothetical protein